MGNLVISRGMDWQTLAHLMFTFYFFFAIDFLLESKQILWDLGVATFCVCRLVWWAFRCFFQFFKHEAFALSKKVVTFLFLSLELLILVIFVRNDNVFWSVFWLRQHLLLLVLLLYC
jgi:hypothetical protein